MELKKLIKTKNKCLTTLLKVSQDFLFEVQTGKFENLDQFQKTRDRILKIIAHVDSKINRIVHKINADTISDVDRCVMRLDLEEKNLIVTEILRVDEKIMKAIENEISITLQRLSVEEKNKNTISKFKSEWINNPGKGLDQTL